MSSRSPEADARRVGLHEARSVDGSDEREKSRSLQPEPTIIATVLVALLLVYRAYQLSRAYFWQDDFLYLYRAHTQPFTLDTLLVDYHGHLMPGSFLVAEVVSKFGEHQWLAASTVTWGLTALAVGLGTYVMFDLFGRRWLTLVPVVAFVFSPLWATPTLWWAAALQSLPLQAALFASILFAYRYILSPTLPTMIGLLGAYIVGLFFWEKALAIPFVTLLVLLLVLGTRKPSISRRVLFRHLAPVVCGWIVVSASYLVLFLRRVDLLAQASGSGGTGDVLKAFRFGLTTFITALVGGPWRSTTGVDTLTPSPSPAATIIAIQLVVIAAALVLSYGGRFRFVAAALVVALVWVVDVAAVALTRLDFLGPAQATDPRYLTEAAVVAAVALGACLQADGNGFLARSTPRSSTRSLIALGVVLLLFVNSALVTQQTLTEVAHRRPGSTWTTEAVSELAKRDNVSVYDGPVPSAIIGDIFINDAKASRVLAASGRKVAWNRSGTELYMFDGLGVLRTADVKDYVADAGAGPDPDCGWGITQKESRTIQFEPIKLKEHPVVIGYFSGEPAVLSVGLGTSTQDFSIPAGLHRLFVFTDERVNGVTLRLARGTTVCVTDVRVGTMWPQQ